MNLAAEIMELRTRLGEPERSGDTGFFTNDELAEWIYQGELKVAKDLVEDALLSLHTENAALTVSSGVAALPTDFLRILECLSNTVNGVRRAKLLHYDVFEQYRHNPLTRGTEEFPIAAVKGANLLIDPVPVNSPASVILRYTKIPTRRYKYYTGAATGVGTTTSIVDDQAPSTVGNGFFTGCNLIIKSGEQSFVERTLTGYTAASGTFAFTTALGGTLVVGDQFAVGQVSDLPAACYPLWLDWASYLAMRKDRETEEATLFLNSYRDWVQQINQRYMNLHAAEPSRERAK